MLETAEVIQAGQYSYWQLFISMPWYITILPIAIFLVYVIYVAKFIHNWDRTPYYLIGYIILIILIFINIESIYNERKKYIENWKEEYVHPYLEQLPTREEEVVYIKFDPEIKTQNIYTGKSEHLTPMTIAYKDAGWVKYVTTWVNTSMTLTDKEKPYMRFVELTEDLGNGVDKGIYNQIVYLPENYTFNEIQ